MKIFTPNISMNRLFDFLNTLLTRLLPPESKLKDYLASYITVIKTHSMI
jgi:hypothetical protein